jgi:tetratricopeptide (TPR) repeat protein
MEVVRATASASCVAQRIAAAEPATTAMRVGLGIRTAGERFPDTKLQPAFDAGGVAYAPHANYFRRRQRRGFRMSAKENWFRLPCLTPATKFEFEHRLFRSRSSRHEYMRIQSVALIEASAFDQALLLIDRILQEEPNYIFANWLYEWRADCLRKMGKPSEATADYVKAMDLTRDRNGGEGRAHLSFASLVYELRQADLYDAALECLTEFGDPHPMFPIDEFRQFGMAALLLNAQGKFEMALPPARRALTAAAKQRSAAPKHPALGLVRDAFAEMRKEVKSIADREAGGDAPSRGS